MSKYKIGQMIYRAQLVNTLTDTNIILVTGHEIVLAKKTYRTEPSICSKTILYDQDLDLYSVSAEDAVKLLQENSRYKVQRADDTLTTAVFNLSVAMSAPVKVFSADDYRQKVIDDKVRWDKLNKKDIL